MGKENFIIDVKVVTRALLLIVLLLVISHMVLYFLLKYSGGYFVENIYHFFDLGDERNLPTFYSSLLLLFASLLLYIISTYLSRRGYRYSHRWTLLSLIFLFVSADESINIHEKLGAVFKKFVGSSNLPDYLQYGWVLPYLILLLFLGIYFVRFFLEMDRKTLLRFSIAFSVYVTGAAGFEMIESHYHQTYGTYHFMYKLFVTIEETMEMTGTIIFIRALLLYINENLNDFGFRVVKGSE
jgi:hypothetical protein